MYALVLPLGHKLKIFAKNLCVRDNYVDISVVVGSAWSPGNILGLISTKSIVDVVL